MASQAYLAHARAHCWSGVQMPIAVSKFIHVQKQLKFYTTQRIMLLQCILRHEPTSSLITSSDHLSKPKLQPPRSCCMPQRKQCTLILEAVQKLNVLLQ